MKRIVLFFTLVTLARADELPGHSAHGEAFNEGPRQAAVLIPGCGDAVKFPISTKNTDAQKFFTQGVGQLHGFWYYEAERSFRQVAALDPECAMAYWGMAMANVNNEKRAKAFIAKAAPLKAKASPREQQWIGMLETLYKDDKRDKKQRSLDCIRDLEQLVQDDPKDIEAKAFLVWRIWFSRDEATISSHQAVDALLDQIFAALPNHPAHHYRIHLWDGANKPARALTSAAQCGQAAPGIAHMWHMPGHTYAKSKRFDDAAWQQEASTRADHAYMIRSYILPDQIHNYAHNEEWLVRTFNELGRAKDAAALAKSLIGNPRHPSNNTLDKQNTSASYGRTRLIETLTKWELWDDLKTFTATPAGHPAHDITRLRAAGVAAYHLNDTDALTKALKDLEATQPPPPPKPPEKTDKPESSDKTKRTLTKAPEASKAESKSPPKSDSKSAPKTESKPPVKKPDAKAQATSEVKMLIALLTPKLSNENKTKLLEALKDSDIPKDRMARYWLKLDNKTKAAELAKNLPQDLAGQIVKAEVLHASGKADEAKKAFEEVQKLAFAMDRDLPAFKRLTTTFAKDANWPAPAPKRTDNGTRPEITTLGPVHWHPPVAPVFEAVDLDAKPVKSSDFTAKKPTLFMFYLGHECGHCVEQMQAFSKTAADFEKAGIQLVGVTIEPSPVAKNLRAKLELKKDAPLPFPILCDSSLEAFKKVRAYDDFEKETLHATLLIDTKGNQRWQ
ncbi:MAG: redoxin domain-containing protein, partial [Verrucomicrobiaceae bacterium]|nr:redoxin domain-containing protein [Verrucomicrobiaceae bacterium]